MLILNEHEIKSILSRRGGDYISTPGEGRLSYES